MIDIKAAKKAIFADLGKLLSSFNIEYNVFDNNYTFRCPVHEGSDNDSAVTINPTQMRWRCWTRGCHENFGTDIFGLVSGILSNGSQEKATFSDAIRYVTSLYDLSGHTVRRVVEKVNPEQEFCDLVKVFKNVDIPKQSLSADVPLRYDDQISTGGSRGEGKPNTLLRPSEYFKGRGFSDSVLRVFEITDCRDRNSPFAYRALIPVIGEDGNAVATIARGTRDWMHPKYLFSKGFRKSEYIYNFGRAIERALQVGCLFICEGQGDVWRFWEAGVLNAVGIFGKELSPKQFSMLMKSGITTLVVVTDNDQAGRESKIKMQRELSRYFTLRFPKMKSKDIGALSVEQVKTDILTQVRGLY